jgi:toxin ParE1/3/4
MRTIRLSIDAELDLLEIWNYLAEYDEVSADSLIDEIVAKYEMLIDFPEMGHIWVKTSQDYRILNAGKYIIFYRLIPSGVAIARVIHGSRNLTDILQKE